MTYGNYSVSVRQISAAGVKGAWHFLGVSIQGWTHSVMGGTEYYSRYESAGTPRLISTITVRKLPKARVSISGENTKQPYSFDFKNSVDARRQFVLSQGLGLAVVDPKGNGSIMGGTTA